MPHPVCFLGATKAFDRVDYAVLFQKLLSRNVPGYIVIFLWNWCNKHYARILWAGILSDSFNICNDVRQGRILSPFLFAIYIDQLSSPAGCWCWLSFRQLDCDFYLQTIWLSLLPLPKVYKSYWTFTVILQIHTDSFWMYPNRSVWLYILKVVLLPRESSFVFVRIAVYRQLCIFTGSIARSASRRYLIYSEADFEVFRPAGRHVTPMGVKFCMEEGT